EESKAAGQTRNSSESGRGVQESAGITGAGFHLDAFQVEIDKEIDGLFVPAVKPERNEGPVQIGHHEQPKSVQGRSPVTDEQSLRGARKAEGPSTEESKAAGQTINFFESTPGPGIHESAASTGAGFNLDAFQVEIDKEIDVIFVPAVKPERNEGPVQIGHHEQTKSVKDRSPVTDEQSLRGARKAEGPSTEESKAAGQTINFFESTPGPGIQESAASTGAGFNLDAFQVEIDKEIDGIFVPAVKPERNEGPVQIGHHEQTKSVKDRSPVTDEQSLRGARKAEGPSTEESKAAGQTINFFESTPGPGIHESAASTGAGFNLDAFQVEIDKEIDVIFVPAVKPERNEGPVQIGHHEQTKSVKDRSPVTDEQSLRGARKAEGPSTEESKAAGQTINFFESTPGPGIHESAASTGAGFNLDAFQVEIDKEIDVIFVPAVKPERNEGPVQIGHHEQTKSVKDRSPVTDEQSLRGARKAEGPSTEESKAAGQTINFFESTPGPGIQESAASTGAGFNLDAFQVEIDKEIDGIFVPAVKPERNEGPVQIGHHEQTKSVKDRSPVTDEQSLRGARKAEGPSTEESKAAGQTINFFESTPGPGIHESAASTGAGFNLDAFQVEIDKEIDVIFVPAVKPERNEGPVQIGHHEQTKSVKDRSPVTDEQSLRGARKAEGPSTEESKAAGQTINFFESTPGPGIHESAASTGAGFNLDAFQVEIDKEIDVIFVPAVKPERNEGPVQIGHHEQTKSVKDRSPVTDEQSLRGARKAEGPSTEESKAAGQTINFFESTPGPGIQESAASTGAGFNLDAFQVEIDKEIDGIFVPAVKPERNEGPVQIGHHEQTKSVKDRSPVTDEQSLRGARKAEGPSTEESKAAGQTINFFESTPGPGIHESAASTGAGFNLDAFQVEIDKEIDVIFVPAVKPERNEGPVQIGHHEQTKSVKDRSPVTDEQSLRGARKAEGPSTEESKAAGQTINFFESSPGPGIQESAASSGAGLNLDSLQVEIDKEIDSLFVPAVKPGLNEGTVQIGRHEQPKSVQGESPVIAEQSLRDTRKAGGPSLEPSPRAASRTKYDESPPDNGLDSQRYHSHELSKLIEMFNAAYLSLDWELSRENIQKFLAALKQLEPFAARSAEARSVLRILEVILKRLQERPHAVNSSL